MKTTADNHKHSLFTKYRPHAWSDVRGQNHIISIMKGMLKRGTHKYINGIILGGCVVPSTKIKIRYKKGNKTLKVVDSR